MLADGFEITGKSNRKRRKLEPKPKGSKECTSVDDLATHPKKIAEVKRWLEWGVSSSNILLLTGPAGSAKTSTLKYVAESLNIDVQEWINPVDKIEFKQDSNWLEPVFCDSNSYSEPKQLVKFESFAFRGSRYPTLFATTQRRILLVEDFPNIFIWKSATFLEFLQKYKLTAKCPIVFIVTDDTKIDLAHKLFPESTILLHKISHIKFNAMSKTGLMNALKKQAGFIAKDTLQQIAESSNGDIRTAISSLNFLKVNAGRKNKSSVSKDVTIDFYHSLGRVLYPKLKEAPHVGGRKFLYDVFSVAEHFNNTFLLMLQENFLKYFSNVNDVIAACEVLSECDFLGSGGESLTAHCGVVCVAGLMLAHKHVKTQYMAMGRSRWSGKSTGVIGEKQRPYPQLGCTSRVVNLDLIPYLKRMPSYAAVLSDSDSRRMPSLLTSALPIFKVPLPPKTVSEDIVDDEMKIEEFDD